MRSEAVLLLFLFGACGNAGKPLDADTRREIDSLYAQQTRALKVELDSQFAQRRLVELPRLVDSLKSVREAEIAEKLRSIGNK
jgi:hypothetical protein